MAIFALFVAGCIPREKPFLPEIYLTVVDAMSGAPIRGAVVTAWGEDYPDRKTSAVTDQDGHASILGQSRTVWVFPAIVPFANPRGRMHIEADGYQERDLDSDEVAASNFKTDHPIALTRAKPPGT